MRLFQRAPHIGPGRTRFRDEPRSTSPPCATGREEYPVLTQVRPEELGGGLLTAEVSSKPNEADGGVVGNLRARFRKGVFWSVAAAVSSSGFNFILSISVARLLGRELFGQFGMVQSTIATLAGIAQLAMGYTATKFVAEFRSSDPVRAGRVIGLCSVVSLVTGSAAAVALCASAPWLATSSLKSPQLAGSLQLASVMVFFMVLTGHQMGALAGLENYRSLAMLALVSGASTLVAASLGAMMWGLSGSIVGLVIGSAIQWALFRNRLNADCERHGIPISRQDLGSEREILLSFAVPAALAGMSSMPALWFANAFLVRQHDGYAQMALYTAAFSLRSLVFFLPSLLNRVSMSLMNNHRGLRDAQSYRRVFKVNLISSTLSVVTGGAIVALLATRLLLVFGKDFASGLPVLLVLLLAAMLEAIAGSLYQVVQAESQMWSSMFMIVIPRDVLIVALAFLWTRTNGAVGLAAAYTVGWSVASLLTALLVIRIGRSSLWQVTGVVRE